MTDKELIQELRSKAEVEGAGSTRRLLELAARRIEERVKEQEAVVRCKDCRYGQYCTDGETTYQCFKWNSAEFGTLHEQNWFCADGERKKVTGDA